MSEGFICEVVVPGYQIEILRDPDNSELPFVVKVSDFGDDFSSPYEFEGCADEAEAQDTLKRFVQAYGKGKILYQVLPQKGG